MKLPIQKDYKHYSSYRDASLRYEITRAVGNTIKTDEYNFLGHGFQPKNCFLSSELTRLVNMQSNSPYLLGIELEVEGVTDRNRSRFSAILQRYLAKSHKVVKDGSLSESGAEIVTIPMSNIDRVKWYNLLKDLRSIGITSHNNNRCGLHVHISRAYLPDTKWKMLQHFIFLNQVKFKKLSRRDLFSYCQFYDAGKYTALNLTKDSTREFRFFRGTLNARSFLASVDICRSLVEYTYTTDQLSWLNWCEYLKGTYPLAYTYLQGKLDDSIREVEVVTNTPVVPRQIRRTRRTLAERRYQLLGRYNAQRGFRRLRYLNSRLELIHSDHEMRSGRFEAVRVDLSSLPMSIKREHVRLFGITCYVWVPDNFTVASDASVWINYYSAGWGNPSRIYIHSPRIEANNDLSNQG